MNIHEINIEAAKEALAETNETLSDEAIENIVCWIEGNFENRELLFAPVENPLHNKIDELKRKHEKDIKQYKEREFIFKKSVAIRRNTRPESVYIENDTVKYDL